MPESAPPLVIRVNGAASAATRASLPASAGARASLPTSTLPPCASCRERPAAFLIESGGVDLEGARPLAPPIARLICPPCHDAQAAGGGLPRGVRAARLPAGMLAALAGAQPRCDVIACSGFVERWGESCPECAERAAAAVAAGLDTIEAKARAVAVNSMRPARLR